MQIRYKKKEKYILIEKIQKQENKISLLITELENKKSVIREIVNLTHELTPSLYETIFKFLIEDD